MRKFKLWLQLALMNADKLDGLFELHNSIVLTQNRLKKFLALELGNHTPSEIAAHVVMWNAQKVKPYEIGLIIMVLNTRSHRGSVTLGYAQELWEKTY